jgi:hypothetical protein
MLLVYGIDFSLFLKLKAIKKSILVKSYDKYIIQENTFDEFDYSIGIRSWDNNNQYVFFNIMNALENVSIVPNKILIVPKSYCPKNEEIQKNIKIITNAWKKANKTEEELNIVYGSFAPH